MCRGTEPGEGTVTGLQNHPKTGDRNERTTYPGVRGKRGSVRSHSGRRPVTGDIINSEGDL